jgi:hypothetical protein
MQPPHCCTSARRPPSSAGVSSNSRWTRSVTTNSPGRRWRRRRSPSVRQAPTSRPPGRGLAAACRRRCRPRGQRTRSGCAWRVDCSDASAETGDGDLCAVSDPLQRCVIEGGTTRSEGMTPGREVSVRDKRRAPTAALIALALTLTACGGASKVKQITGGGSACGAPAYLLGIVGRQRQRAAARERSRPSRGA